MSGDIAGTSGDETFSDDLTLTQMHAKLSQMETTMFPKFMDSPAGKLITGMDSDYSISTGAPPTHLVMQVEYAKVANYDIPSKLHLEVKPYTFDFTLSGCVVNPPAAQ